MSLLAGIDPDLDSVAALDRGEHIEPYVTSMVDAVNTKNGETITVADRSGRVRPQFAEGARLLRQCIVSTVSSPNPD